MTDIADLLGSLQSRRRTRNYDVTNIGLLADYLEEYLVPVGSVISKFTTTSPGDAWVQVDGQSLLKSEYPDLYADIGGTFGETATHFNLPDLSDSYLVGEGVLAAAATGGANSINLTTGQLPSHNHAITDPGHTHTFTGSPHGHTVTDTGHSHGITDPGHTHSSDQDGGAADTATGSDETTASAGTTGSATTGVSVDNATTGVTVDNATAGGSNSSETTGISLADTGNGDSIDNRPQSIAVYYFMKAKV